MIKVALIGTHGTGKTTACHELVGGLKKKGVNAEYLGETARKAEQRGLKINEGTTLGAQLWIFHTQIARELEFLARPDVDVLVCDRCVVDNYMYLINKFGHQGVIDEMVNSHTGTYAYLFKVPINEKYRTNDGVRSTSPEFQERIDRLLKKELRKRKFEYWNYPGPESAIEIILKGRQNGKL